MNCMPRCISRVVFFALFGLFLVFCRPNTASASEIDNLLRDTGVKVGGWINGGATYNPNPMDGFNGTVTFADRANTAQLNQFNMYMQRTVVTEGKAFDIGGRFDFMYGTDAIYTQAFGIPQFDVNTGQLQNRGNWDLYLCCNSTRTYGIALPQAYLEAYLPVGNGLNIKAGHFYSPTGYETVPAPDNFFYTHAYSFTNGEPFTHVGVVGNYQAASNWSLMGGVTTGSATGGWDGTFNKQLGNWGGLAGITWASDDRRTSVNLAGTYAATSTRSDEPWEWYSLVLQHRITSRTHFVLHHVHGYAGGVLLNGTQKNAEWYGINTHLYYDLLDDLSIGLRTEWFRDKDGFRVPSPFRVAAAVNSTGSSFAGNIATVTSAPADYYGVTLGMNWKPAKRLSIDWKPMQKLNIRPNIRYDRADGLDQTYRPFNGRKDQVLFSLDAMIPF